MSPLRKRSALWSHFSETENKKAKCLYCTQILAIPNGNVGNLGRHMKNKHPTIALVPKRHPFAASQEDSNHQDSGIGSHFAVAEPQTLPSDGTTHSQPRRQTTAPSVMDFIQSSKPVPVRRAELLDEQLILMIAKEYHPLKLVDDPEFRKFVNMLCPGYTLPTRKTLSESLLSRLYTRTLEIAKAKLEAANYVCLATDGWTSINNDSFLAVTAHFIRSTDKETKLESILLGCIEYNDRHTSSNLCNFLQDLARKWCMDHKITAIASDNAANISAAIREGNWRQIPCFAHTLNLCVQAAIAHISPTVVKVKGVVEFFKRSAQAQRKLTDLQKQLGLPDLKLKQEVSTRWNSTFDMLFRLLVLKDAVVATVALLRSDLMLHHNDWTILEHAVPILEMFSKVTRELSYEKNVTLSKVIPICRLMSSNTKTRLRQPIQVQVITDMLQTLDQELDRRFANIETNVLYTEATILDPRFKQRAFKSTQCFDRALIELKHNVARASRSTVCPLSVQLIDTTTLPASSMSQPASSSIWDEFDRDVAELRPTNTAAAGIIEVDKYMSEPVLPRTSDPFLWWHERRVVYPLLYKYMLKRLNLVATSVPCERVFSKAGYIMNERRTRLKSKKLDQLLFISANK